MSKGRLALIIGAVIAVLALIVTAVLGLATNFASELPQLPGPLDLIRAHPLRTMAGAVGILCVLAMVGGLTSTSGAPQASKDDVDGLHERFDELAVRSVADDRMQQMPPHARELLSQADKESRIRIWQVVAPFTDATVDPRTLAKEWAQEPPEILDELPVIARLIVAELSIAYGQAAAAIAHMRAAVQRGVSPRVYWLFRIAKLNGEIASEESPEFRAAMAEVERTDASYPLARAIRARDDQAWAQVAREMQDWEPLTGWERDIAALYRAVSLQLLGRMDEAITSLETALDDNLGTSCALLLSRLLRARAVEGTGDSRLLDAQHAMEVAVRARNLRRTWRGDSAEATAIAAEAAMTADDPAMVWTLTQPAPQGQATDAEATDLRVLPLAAMGAALTGRIAQARELIPAEDGYVRRRVEAEIASASHQESAAEAWRSALAVAETDEQKIHALRGLAMDGATDSAVLDDLRFRYPDAVADIELIIEIHTASEPGRDERLRRLEAVSPLATVERASILRRNDPGAAAQILLDATERWQHPRLYPMAVDCYQQAGMLSEAEQAAHNCLSLYDASWPGRAGVMRQLYDIQSLRTDWVSAARTARALLNIDPNDENVRWCLTWALHRGGDPEDAWRTLNRLGHRPTPTTPLQARLLLDLIRRYASADEIARTALTMLQAFRDDQEVHAAAIHAVTMRVDRDELPEELGAQVRQAWQEFLDRYPDSTFHRAHAIDPSDPEHPLGDLESPLRQQAESYQEALRLIREDGYPLGILNQAVPKPYAAIFLFRPLGYHRMVYPGLADQALELGIARAALESGVLVDASALYTLSLLPDTAPTLLALISRPVVTDAGLQDLLATEDMVNIPSAGTLSYDSRAERVVAVDTNPEAVARQREQARAMLATARGLRRISHPEPVHLASPEVEGRAVWALTLDAAKHHDLPLLADDTGLRTVAHSMGIKTFSTYALLLVAQERGQINTTTAHEVKRELVREYTMDLPYEHELLRSVAAERNWEPCSVTTILSRGATWVHSQQALALFFEGFQRAPDKNAATTWAYAAISGMQELPSAGNISDRLKMFFIMTIVTLTDQQDRLPVVVTALEAAAPDIADAVIRGALKDLWSRIAQQLPIEQAVTSFLGL